MDKVSPFLTKPTVDSLTPLEIDTLIFPKLPPVTIIEQASLVLGFAKIKINPSEGAVIL